MNFLAKLHVVIDADLCVRYVSVSKTNFYWAPIEHQTEQPNRVAMSVIKITDVVGAAADLEIRDDSPFAKAKITQLLSTIGSLIADLNKRVDQTDISRVDMGIQFSTPSSLIDGVPTLTVNGGINCDLAVRTPADKFLFPPDNFAPVIAISANQSWVGFTLDVNIGIGLSAAADGFGIAVKAGTKIALTTFTLIETVAPPLPSLKDAIVDALGAC